jgi:quinol monooxygenase YgiN
MVIYEVNLSVEPEISESYCAWLTEHIEEILELEGFIKATWYNIEPESEIAKKQYCIHYSLSDRDALERYFKEDAPRLREDGLKRFPGQFQAHRRILTLGP